MAASRVKTVASAYIFPGVSPIVKISKTGEKALMQCEITVYEKNGPSMENMRILEY